MYISVIALTMMTNILNASLLLFFFSTYLSEFWLVSIQNLTYFPTKFISENRKKKQFFIMLTGTGILSVIIFTTCLESFNDLNLYLFDC